jgi:MFS family permease
MGPHWGKRLQRGTPLGETSSGETPLGKNAFRGGTPLGQTPAAWPYDVLLTSSLPDSGAAHLGPPTLVHSDQPKAPRRRPSRTFGALAIYNYRLYIAGQAVSQSGTWLQRTAQAWLVLQLTDSAVALGAITALQTLPFLLLSLFGGVVADRVPKRPFLMVVIGLEVVQATILAALTLSGRIELWHLYVLAFALGVLTALEAPTRQSFVSELVGRERIQSAVSLNSSVFNAARIIGPGVAGVVIAAVGTGVCFALNAASFVAVLAGLALMRPAEFVPARRAQHGRILSQLVEGLAYVLRTPELLFPVVLLAFLGTFGYNFLVVLPLLARYTLNAGAVGFGILDASMGVGSIVGALAVATRLAPERRNVLIGATIFSVLLGGVAASQNLYLSMGILMLLGAASVSYMALTNTTLQLGASEQYRGRVLSLYLLLNQGTTPIGGAVTGALAEGWGVQVAIGLEAAVCLATALVAFAVLRRGGPIRARGDS